MDVAAQTSSARTDGFGGELSRQFKTVIVCEDSATGARAKAAFERLTSQFAAPDTANCSLWDFDRLTDVRTRNTASLEAADADLVIVSGHASVGLPNAVKNWIWTWLPTGRAHSAALAMTFDDCTACEGGQRRHASPICAAVRQAALMGRMEFLCTRPEWLKTAEEGYLQQMTERAHKTSSVLENIINRRGAPRWGLNE